MGEVMDKVMEYNPGSTPITKVNGRKVRSDKGGKHKVKGIRKARAPKGKSKLNPVGDYPSGQRADGQPKMKAIARKGSRKYGHLRDGTQLSAGWIADNHTPPPDPPKQRYPINHPLWSAFEVWVRTSQVVRHDLLDFHPDSMSGKDWEQVWLIFLNGATLGAGVVARKVGLIKHPSSR